MEIKGHNGRQNSRLALCNNEEVSLGMSAHLALVLLQVAPQLLALVAVGFGGIQPAALVQCPHQFPLLLAERSGNKQDGDYA